MRKRALLGVLAFVFLSAVFVRLDGQQWLRDRLREPGVRSAFEREKAACLADRRKGRPVGLGTHEKLAAAIRELGRLRVEEAVPDLLLLLDNGIHPSACIDALGAIADDRAIFALAARALSPGSAYDSEAAKHLRRIAVPLLPILVRGLSSPDPLLRRRAAILLGRLPAEFQGVSASVAADATLFDVPPEASSALLPSFRDPSPAIRFEAVRAFLALGGGWRAARSHLAGESNLSIRDLLDGIPGALASGERPNWSPRVPLDYFAVRSAAMHQTWLPSAENYRHVSGWQAFRDGLESRVSLPESTVTFPEPRFALNRPIWVRVEVRNPGPAPRSIPTPGPRAPLVTLLLRDAYGNFERIRWEELEVVSELAGDGGATTVTLEPGDVVVAELDLVRGLSRLQFNGRYSIGVHVKGNEPPLLDFKVQDIPEPPWLSHYDGELGVDPSRIYFEDVDYSLPSALQEQPSPEPAPSAAADEVLASEAEARLQRFLETGDRRLLYDLTRTLSARELATGLRKLPVTIRPSGKTEPHRLIDRQASEPSDVLEELRALRADDGAIHLLIERRFLVPIPDRLGNPRSWKYLVLYATFRDGVLSEPEVVCEDCSDPAASVAPDGSLWLVTAEGEGLSARQRSHDGAWSSPEAIVDDMPRMIRGFDVAIDGRGSLFVVWAPWYKKEEPALFKLRVREASGWQPPESLPLPLGLAAIHPRALWLNGQLGILAATQEGVARAHFPALFLRREKARLDHRKLDLNGGDLESAPSGEPLLFVEHAYQAAATSELLELRAFSLTPKGALAELGSLMAPEGGYRGLGLATDAAGRTVVLAGWNGHALLLRRTDPDRTRAALLALGPKPKLVGVGNLPKPLALSSPQLFVAGDRFDAFWLETIWELEGTQPRPRASRLWFLSGRFSELEWLDVTELAVALRPTTGLLRSDLEFLGRVALADARSAEERGASLAALERYVWLIDGSREVGRFLKGANASLPAIWIEQRFRNGDAEVRQRLWTLAAERPLFFAPDSSFLRLLAGEIGPRVRIERAKPRAETR